MKLKLPARQPQCAFPRRPANARAIALVITLLMLSVITFLAIAFLSMTRRDRNAVTASLDIDTAHTMSDAALARAQTEIIARMMAHHDILSYDYMVSRNFINPLGFNKQLPGYFTNVNYNNYYNASGGGSPFNWGGNAAGAKAWAQNIANLYYDPRPPVFVITNGDLSKPATDFRYWVDINRNGRFEGSGYLPVYDNFGNITYDSQGNTIAANFTGEPEWIGVLKYPEYVHSPTNQFIGRYAYLVLPIGKTLDLNFIHNHAKGAPSMANDGFIRDQGVGSWELNLAALLNDLSTNMYQAPVNVPYSYVPLPGTANQGDSFVDANNFLSFRYQTNYKSPHTLGFFYPTNVPQFAQDGIDEYGSSPATVAPFDFTAATDPDSINNPNTLPWPGSYNTNLFYDVQDWFDPAKTGPQFQYRLNTVLSNYNSYDTYTFQRLLGCIGTGSNPEYGVYVYDNSGNQALRTKVNINYNNTAQIQAGPYTPMPTNLVPWDPLGFFTNAADLLLRSQSYVVTNFAGIVIATNYFGITNIPVYNSTNAGIRYSAKIHRMLQLAANIYEASVGSNPTNYNAKVFPTVYYPHIYRPLFSAGYVNGAFTVNIVGFTNAVLADTVNINTYPLVDLFNSNNIPSGPPTTLPSNFNYWGIPWVVGAVKGLPSFNRYNYDSRILVTRKVLFTRQGTFAAPLTNVPPQYTNQFYIMNISNIFGVDAWNSYSNVFPLQVGVYVTNYVTVQVTNNYNRSYTNSFSFFANKTISSWPGWNGSRTAPTGFMSFFQTNVLSLPPGYYSDATLTYQPFTITNYNGGALPADLQQTTFPVHTWTYTVTNHLMYFMYDVNSSRLLDFVNLGPFGSSNIFVPARALDGRPDPYWLTNGANDVSGYSQGLSNQIQTAEVLDSQQILLNSLTAKPGTKIYGDFMFGTAFNPSNIVQQNENWVANDPLVHYTVDDLTWPVYGDPPTPPLDANFLVAQLTNSVGTVSQRYSPWPGQGNFAGQQLFMDSSMSNSSSWQFPTNSFPSVGWLGRVHRGTPWQTVYLKADSPTGQGQPLLQWASWVNSVDSYPTNDWALVDLFSTTPNDNAARGLLSVNQTNDAAWSALFDGVIAMTNNTGGVAIAPNTGIYSTTNFMDATNGINVARTNIYSANGTVAPYNPNGIFHKVGDILQAPILTTRSPFVADLLAEGGTPTDEMVERIPQQILSLLKVGQPQFVIYAWGQSLKPKNLYSSPAIGFDPALNNICTNYEITGEFLGRIVCHVVGDTTAAKPKVVIDSYNIEPGD